MPDLIVGTESGFAVLLSDGPGIFGTPIYTQNSTGATELSVADVNGDGIPDVLVTAGSSRIFLGRGDGNFNAGEILESVNFNPPFSGIVDNGELADVNGDDCPDAIVVSSDTQASVFYGDCKGDFDNAITAPDHGMGDVAYGLAVVDINGDGYPDLIIGGVPLPGYTPFQIGVATGDTIGVRLNDGTGHFGALRMYRGDPGLPELTEGQHRDPNVFAVPHYWLAQSWVEAILADKWRRHWFLVWRRITRNTDQRTFIASIVPLCGFANSGITGFVSNTPQSALLGNLSSFVFDYVARQKLGGTNMAHFVTKQLPVLSPQIYNYPCGWSNPSDTFEDWLLPRILELTPLRARGTGEPTTQFGPT